MVKATAPEVSLVFDTTSRPAELEAKLRDGDMHTAVDWLSIDANWCVDEKLFDNRLLIITREGHPRINARLTLDYLRKVELVDLRPRVEVGDQPPGLLEFHRLPLRVGFHVNELFEMLPVVLGSDMLIWFENARAYAMGRVNQILPFPADLPPLRINLLWKSAVATVSQGKTLYSGTLAGWSEYEKTCALPAAA